MSEPLVLSITEAAKLLGIGERTAYDLIARGEFPVPVLRIGTRRKVARRALLAYVGDTDEPAQAPTPPRPLTERIAALSIEDQARVEGFVAALESSGADPAWVNR